MDWRNTCKQLIHIRFGMHTSRCTRTKTWRYCHRWGRQMTSINSWGECLKIRYIADMYSDNINLSDVIVAKRLTRRLLSVSKWCINGGQAKFDEKGGYLISKSVQHHRFLLDPKTNLYMLQTTNKGVEEQCFMNLPQDKKRLRTRRKLRNVPFRTISK
jgi:hypothetical protein